MIRDLLVRTAARCFPARRIALFAALCLGPSLGAQEPAVEARTHVVKAGDTLWEIARIYLADPFLWPEVYRVNTAVVEDPHWIYAGEKLRIPNPGEVAVAGQAKVGPPSKEPVNPAPTVAVAPTPGAPAGQLPSAVPEPEVLPTFEATGPTVFARMPRTRLGVGARRGFYATDTPRPTVRAGEVIAAPYVESGRGPTRAGQIVATSEIAGTGAAATRGKVGLNERVYVHTAEGSAPKVGDRYLAYSLGPELPGQGVLVIPVGVLAVDGVTDAAAGEATPMRLVQQFGEVPMGGGVIPLEPSAIPVDVQPAAVVEGGLETRVTWVHHESLLPSLQAYVVLEASEKDGVKLGDQLTVVRPAKRGEDGSVHPEQRIAVVQVLRVTSGGTSAIVIDHNQPAIRVGTLARMTARMP
ncbi:MAG: LysM peptidoglycan-binding domain-containing protein [Gemmatimonadaceae bacterium]